MFVVCRLEEKAGGVVSLPAARFQRWGRRGAGAANRRNRLSVATVVCLSGRPTCIESMRQRLNWVVAVSMLMSFRGNAVNL